MTTIKKLFGLLLVAGLTITACSKPEMDAPSRPQTQAPAPTPTPAPAADAADTFTAWSDWSPAFTDQKEDFTQTRTRSIQVNGNADATPPAGPLEDSRDVSVSVETLITNSNERFIDLDVNADGDQIDYLSLTSTIYIASIGGSFSGDDVLAITQDQDLNFLTRNFGKWAGGAGLTSPFIYTVGSAYSNGGTEIELDAVVGFDILDTDIVGYYSDNGGECFKLSPDVPFDSAEVVDLTLDGFETFVQGVPVEYLFIEADVAFLHQNGIYKADLYSVFGITDYDDVSYMTFGQSVYAGDLELFLQRGSMAYYGDELDINDFTCSSAGKGTKKMFDGIQLSKWNK